MSLQLVLCQVVILFSLEFHTASCDTFYIVPTPDSHCPDEFIGVPCLTLQQYASNPSQSQNITFLVEPGTYNLSIVLTVSNGYNFTMSSSNATVVCTSSTAQFTFSTVENVHISGVTFQGCTGTAVRMSSISDATVLNGSSTAQFTFDSVENVHISEMTFPVIAGTAVVMSRISNATVLFGLSTAPFTFSMVDNVHINGMTFRGCRNTAVRMSAVMRAEVISSNFIDNYNNFYSNGGGLSVTSSFITIIDSEFQNNVAYRSGGAIYATSSTLEILRSTFNQSRANSRSGGAIYAISSTLTIHLSSFSYSRADDNGGAIYAYYSNLIINMSTFIYSSVYRYSGGAIYYESYYSYESVLGRIFQLNNTVFVSNRAGRYGGSGGAVYVSNTLYNSYYYRNISVIVTHCQFFNNTAVGSGGALFASTTMSSNRYQTGSNTMVEIFQTDCENNIANSFGGAVYVDGTNTSLSVAGSSFINNTAVQEGGGAIYSNGRYSNVTLSSSTFTNNSASYCGVLDVDDYNHFSVNLTNSVFTYNTATGQTIGGGVACIRNASIIIINSVFKHNFANYHAGVFYIDESVTTVDGSLFVNNSVAVDGGVFYTYVHASDYIIRRSQFSENSAGDDGGVMFIGRLNSFVSIDESIFDFNSAIDRGGIIALIASSIFMVINRTNIFNNTAEYGGVMSACNSQVTLFDDYLFVTVDPLLSFCTLYEGDIRHFNITAPQVPEIVMTTTPPTTAPSTTTESPTTTAPPTTAEPPTTTAPPTTAEPPTTTAPPTTAEPPTTTFPPTTTEPPTTTAPPTTTELPTVTAPPTTTKPPTTTAPPITVPHVKTLPTIDTKSPATAAPPTTSELLTTLAPTFTTDMSAFTEIKVNEKEGIAEYKLSIFVAFSAVALSVSLIAIVVVLVRELLQCIHKNGTKKKATFTPEIPEMTDYRKESLNSFRTRSSESPMYDKSFEEKEQDL